MRPTVHPAMLAAIFHRSPSLSNQTDSSAAKVILWTTRVDTAGLAPAGIVMRVYYSPLSIQRNATERT